MSVTAAGRALGGYEEFLERKTQLDGATGFEPDWLPDFLFGFQRSLVEWAVRQGRAAIFADCGLGKAQPDDEIVLTPAGWLPIGALAVGSHVVGSDGCATEVLGVYPQGERPIARVTFSDGATVRCDLEHLWTVATDNDVARGRPWRTLPLRDIVGAGLGGLSTRPTLRWRVPVMRPLDLPARALPIDPYVLGVLLGDGNLSRQQITFTTVDDEMVEAVAARVSEPVRVVALGGGDRAPSYRLSVAKAGTHHRNPLVAALSDLDLLGKLAHEKSIPAEYQLAAIDQRVALLRGLMDTDGYVSADGCMQFGSSSAQLVEDVTELVRGLGGLIRRTSKIPAYSHRGERRTGRLHHVLTLRLPPGLVPFGLSRKAARVPASQKYAPVRKIAAVEMEGVAASRCIRVAAPDQLYVTAGHAVTHNTPMQLAWAENVRRRTGKPVLVVAPLAVSYQTVAEAEKFGVEAAVSRVGKVTAGITVTNYERLHHFDREAFGGVVCDESSALKSFDGVRRALVTEFLRTHRYRLLCTATAAPNDYVELGTSSEALGYLGHTDMLSRFFTNRGATFFAKGGGHGQRGEWRFKGHAETPFWRWVSSWARAMRKPSDLGFPDDGFLLPRLEQREHVVEARTRQPGTLFDLPANGIREERDEQRRTIAERCELAADLLADADAAVAWCQLNAEGDLLAGMIDGAVQVSGADDPDRKEEALLAFGRGEIRVLVTKPAIGAWGLNWQHCARMSYFPSYSYEQLYQAVRRSWRFGQQRPVRVDLITTEGGLNALRSLERKSAQAERMFDALVAHMRDALALARSETYDNEVEVPEWLRC